MEKETAKKERFIKSTAHLPVKNLKATLDFYRDKLGFTDEWIYGEFDGGISRDQLQMLFAEDDKFTNDINNTHHRLPLLWFVHDIDTIYEEFKHRDIEITDELQPHPYGLREFSFIDINGYYIRIAENGKH